MLTRDKNFKAGDAIIVRYSMEELREELKKYPSEDIYDRGGDSFIKQLLDDCDVYNTKIDYAFEADTISRISMRCRSGKSRRTVRNRRILI